MRHVDDRTADLLQAKGKCQVIPPGGDPQVQCVPALPHDGRQCLHGDPYGPSFVVVVIVVVVGFLGVCGRCFVDVSFSPPPVILPFVRCGSRAAPKEEGRLEMETSKDGLGIFQRPNRQAIDRVEIDVEFLADPRQAADGGAKGSYGRSGNYAVHDSLHTTNIGTGIVVAVVVVVVDLCLGLVFWWVYRR